MILNTCCEHLFLWFLRCFLNLPLKVFPSCSSPSPKTGGFFSHSLGFSWFFWWSSPRLRVFPKTPGMLEILEGVGRVLRLPVSLHSKFLRFETQARAGWNQESESGWVELLGWNKKRVGKNAFFANLVPIYSNNGYILC